MARTNRSSSASEELPKFFGKHGFAYEDPNKIKRGGIGRFNWGTENDDISAAINSDEFNFGRARRHSNSNGHRPRTRNMSTSSDSSDFAVDEE